MDHKTLKRYKFNIWANDRILNHLKSLPDQVYNEGVDSVFSSIHEVIVHIYMVDGMWLSVMSGDAFEQTMEVIKSLEQKSNDKNLHEMIQLYEELSNDYLKFILSLDNPDESITINHPKYGEMVADISDLVEHVVNHGTYHRGNITAMLRQQGYPGIPTDYIFYLYDK
ncbi:MAG: DinB family protein [Sphaerochaetaceae bacterium]